MFWVLNFAKRGGSLKGAIKEFTKMNGRMPSSAEMNKMETIIKDAQSNVIPFPKQKSSLAELLRTGVVKRGVAPKTTPKDPIDQRWASQEEWKAKMKAENKAALKRFEEKFGKPEDRALGGRIGYAAGKIVKGASWIIKNLKRTYLELIEGKGPFANLNDLQRESYKWELLAQIKKLERGEPIPQELLTNMRQDKRFKDIVKTPSRDPELRELEEVLLEDKQSYLDYAEKQSKASDSLAKEFGYGEYAPSEIKKRQIETLKEFDVTGRKKNASGGLAGQLHLNQGGRVRFANGGPGYLDPYSGNWINPWESGVAGKTQEEYEASQGWAPPYDVYTGYTPTEYYPSWLLPDLVDSGYGSPQEAYEKNLEALKSDIFRYSDPYNPYAFEYSDTGTGLVARDPSTRIRTGSSRVLRDTTAGQLAKDWDAYEAWKQSRYDIGKSQLDAALARAIAAQAPATQSQTTAAPTTAAPVTQTAPVTTQAAPTGIQTIPGEKKSFNVMMDEKGNVADDQGIAELARETGVAPDIQNYPIRSMSDLQRMIGPGEDISEGTGYSMPRPSVEQRMQEAAAKGLDPRMGRTYAENIQAMADPRMRGAKGGLAKILGV